MRLEDHLKLGVRIDGTKQVKLSNISVNMQSNAQRVETLEGLAGKTPGSRSLEITATWAVPLGGPEFDIATAASLGTYHDVQIPYGDKTIASRGWFQDAGLSQSTGASTECTATYVGSFDPPE